MRRGRHGAGSRLAQALRGFAEGIQGQPLDAERSHGDWWLVAPFLLLPAYALAEAVLGW